MLLNAVILPTIVVSTHGLRCQLISDVSKRKHCHYSQMNRGLIVEAYLQDVLNLGTRYREVSHTPAVVPPCKKLCPVHGGPPAGSNVVAKKNSPLPLEIQSGFSSRAVCKLVGISTEQPSSHRSLVWWWTCVVFLCVTHAEARRYSRQEQIHRPVDQCQVLETA